MGILAILRHGPTPWNESHRLQGRSDVPLGAAGRALVERWRLPEDVRSFDWRTSPLRRCVETAAILRDTHKAPKSPTVESRLIEMSYGEWEGETLADLRARLGDRMAALERRGLDFRAPNGESPRDLQTRLSPFLVEIGEADRDVLAIAHKGVIRALFALATGWTMQDKPPQRLQFDAVHLFRVDRLGGLRIERLNCDIASTTISSGASARAGQP